MLSYFRKNAQSWMIKTILWALVAAFVGTIFLVWGRGSQQGSDTVVATIGGEAIHYREYQNAYSTLLDNYRQFYGRALNQELLRKLQLGKRALDQLVERRLVSMEALRLGLMVSDEDVSRYVQRIPLLQSNGRFDSQRYDNFLRVRGLQSRQFEELMRSDLLLQRYRDFISQGVKVTGDEVADAYRQKNEQVNISYVRFPGSRFRNEVKVSDADISAYYKAHAASYREPEKRRIEYLQVRFADFEAAVEVSDEEVQTYYRKNRKEFITGKRKETEIRARHVLIKVKPTATDEERQAARRKAEEVRAKASAGEDFATLAKQYSQGPSAPEGGDLGFFARGVMVKAFSDAAFALQPGDISDVVETEFGFHVIKVEEIRQPEIKPLDAVRPTIVKTLAGRGAKKLARDVANHILREDIEGIGFAALAERYKLKRRQPPAFPRRGPIDGLARLVANDLTKATFALEANEFSEAIETTTGIFFLHLLEVLPSYVPKEKEVRTKVEQAIVRQQGKELAKRVANGLAELIEKTPLTFDDIVAAGRYQVEQPEPFSRHGAISGVGRSPTLVKQAFANKPGYLSVFSADDSAFLYRLDDLVPISEEKFSDERHDFALQLVKRKASRFYATWLQELRQTAQVSINDALIIQ